MLSISAAVFPMGVNTRSIAATSRGFGARVIEHIARIRVAPTVVRTGAVQMASHAASAIRPIGGGAVCPAEPPTWQINPERVAQRVSSHRSRRTDRRRASVRLTRKKNARVVHDPG
jgi:hypothetical protein